MIAVDTPMPEFNLDSVHDTHMQSTEISEQVVVLIFATHKHMKALDGWYDRITQTFKDQSVVALPIAVLNSLPGFVPESAIRVRIKQKSKSPVLMDMKGQVATEFGITEDIATIVIVDEARNVRLATQDLDDAIVDTVNALLSD